MHSISPPATLLLVRHAETLWNHERRYAGHSEVPLGPGAEEQIRHLTNLLVKAGPICAYSSPLTRCLATISPTVEILGLPLCLELGLRERNLGEWEGRSETEIIQRYPAFKYPMDAYSGTYEVPKGETLDALELRAHMVLQRIGERHPGQTVLIATHAGVIWTVLDRLITNRPHDLAWPANGTINTVTYHDLSFALQG